MLINGVPGDTIDVADRGFMYGDGLFATLATLGFRAMQLERHLEKMASGAARLGIPWPGIAVFRSDIELLLKTASAADRSVLKLMLTRGAGGRGYAPPDAPVVSRLALRYPFPAYPSAYQTEGIVLRWCETRLGLNPGLAGIKHMNRLEQVLARREWSDTSVQEGLLCDTLGNVIEGTMSNLFIVTHTGELITPDLALCGVSGVQRACIMQLAREQLGVCVRESRLRVEDVMSAAEVFVSNSVIGLWPVRQLADRSWTAPGKMSEKLLELLRQGEVR